jgi:hypothetical protein
MTPAMPDELLADVAEARRRTVEAMRAIMHQDDALDRLVPSDLRLLIGEIDQLRSDLQAIRAIFRVNMLRLSPATSHEEIDRVLSLKVEAEREACAKIADNFGEPAIGKIIRFRNE